MLGMIKLSRSPLLCAIDKLQRPKLLAQKQNFPPAQRPKVRRTIPRFASLRTVLALMLREMSTTYGRTPGGYLWAILEPVAAISLLTAIFSLGFRNPALGVSFAMFYATGILPFGMFNDIAAKLGQALNYSKQLLAYPRVTFVDAVIARFAISVITQILVSYIVMTAIVFLFETRTTLDFVKIAKAFAMASFLGLGIGTLNCYLMKRFDIYQRIWSVATRPLFILSCIFFLFDTIPQPYQDYLWYNPLVHVVGMARSGFYGTYDALYVSELYVCGVALVTLVLGLLLLRKDSKATLER